MVIISDVVKGSKADKAKIKAGDRLVSINGNEIMDVLDYRFYITEKNPVLLFDDGRKVKLKKAEDEESGMLFETYLMDKQRSCKNNCIFCFIDQLPKGLRQTLYFKDDDSRLSFLFGNYITLTNITEHEVKRIIKMHISPINISVHTTNPELRCKIMNNRFAGESLKHLKTFNDAGIKINCQLVLMPGINDGEELKSTLKDLLKLENVQSIAGVSVGLTKHREGLYPLSPYTKEQAAAVTDIMEENYNGKVFASDEFYLKAERELPNSEYYGEFWQIENGVGMYRSFLDEALFALENEEPSPSLKKTCATGVLAKPMISFIVDKAKNKWHNLDCKVIEIENEFFGKNITVSGLITASDIIRTLKGKDLGDLLLLPENMLRHEKDRFLDDVTVEELEKELKVKIKFVAEDGYEFVEALGE